MISIINYPTEDFNDNPEPGTKEVRVHNYQVVITSFTMHLYVSENSEGNITIYSDNENPLRSGIPKEEYSYEIKDAEFNNWLEENKFIP